MKKFLKVLFNIFWAIFIGIESVVINGIMGVACCATIIGIPFGLQYFKFVPLVFAPAGKTVVTRFSRHPVMNTLWLIFGGLEVGLIYSALGIIFCITIIGLPIGRQLFKIAGYNFAPFGCEVVHDGDYTSDKDTYYDTSLVCRRIAANPDAVMGKIADGTDFTVRQYMTDRKDELLKGMYGKKLKNQLNWFLEKGLYAVVAIPFVLFSIPLSNAINNALNYTNPSLASIIAVSCVVVPMFVAAIIQNAIFVSPYNKFSNKFLQPLMDIYPSGSPEGKANVGDLKTVCAQLMIVPPPTKDMIGYFDRPANQPATDNTPDNNSEPFAEEVAKPEQAPAEEKPVEPVEPEKKVADTVVDTPVEEKKED